MELICLRCDEKRDACSCESPLFDPMYGEDNQRESGVGVGMWDYTDLPVRPEDAITLGEGSTPLVECSLGERLGVELYVKDEGANPTGSVYDREMSEAVSAISSLHPETEKVALFSPGNSGVSAAAYAARAGFDAEVVVPSRSRHDAKSMINVHGGDMNVVRGKLPEAEKKFRDNEYGNNVYSLADFDTPYRHDGAKTVGYEISSQVDVDHVVCPVASGSIYLGLDKALESDVRLHAVQPEDCSPVVDAVDMGEYSEFENPDTVVGELEYTSSKAGDVVAEKVSDRGEAVAVPDYESLDRGIEFAESEGVEMSPEGCIALEGAYQLSEHFDERDSVVVVNPSAGRHSADVLRSQLMSHGV